MSPRESSHRLVLGVLMLTVVVVLAALYVTKSDGNHAGLTNDTASSHAEPAREATTEPGRPDLRKKSRRAPTASQPSTTATRQDSLICRRADTREPLAGISLYQNGVVRAGPTQTDGQLLLGDLGWDMRTLWGQGWTPQRLRGAKNPSEVLFVRADSGVVISLQNASPQHKVIRSILQIRGADKPPEGLWSPKLQVSNWDRLTANGAPPGTYDIYLWISENMGTPEPYQLQSVVLQPAQKLRISLDLIADKQDTHEDDS